MLKQNNYNFGGAIIAGLLIFYAGCLNGPGITFDSVNYLYGGVSLSQKGELLRPFANPFIEWPPVYPIIISGLSYLPGKLLHTVFYFHILVITITVYLAAFTAQSLIKNKFLFILCLISLVFSTPLLLVNHFIWSESLFILLTVIYNLFLIKYTQKPTILNWLILLFLGIIICLDRYVGIFFIFSGMGIIYLYTRKNSLWIATIYGFIAILPLIFWFIRNIRLTGFIWNETENFTGSFAAYLISFHDVITTWFLPDEINVFFRMLILIGIIAIQVNQHFKSIKRLLDSKAKAAITVLIFQFFSYYVLAFFSSYITSEPIDDRILAPAYIPAVILFFYYFNLYLLNKTKPIIQLILMTCFLWSAYPVTRALYNIQFWHIQPKKLPSNQDIEPWFEQESRFKEQNNSV